MFATLGKQPILGRAFGAGRGEGRRAGRRRCWARASGSGASGATRASSGRTLVLSGEQLHRHRRHAEGACTASWKNTEVFTPLLRLEDRIGGENNRGNHPGHLRDRPPEAGRRRRPGPGRGEGDRRAARRAVPELEREAEHDASSRCTRPSSASMRPALMLLLGRGRLRAADRLRQRRQPAAGARRRPAARDRGAPGARRATRGRVLRQLLTESVLLSLARRRRRRARRLPRAPGAARRRCPATCRAPTRCGIDVSVLAFTAALAVVTGLAFGIVPAWRALSTRLHEPLKEAGRGSVGPGPAPRAQRARGRRGRDGARAAGRRGPDAAQLLPRAPRRRRLPLRGPS